jgi:hypothetical protein
MGRLGRNLTPARPPFSAMNWTPAASTFRIPPPSRTLWSYGKRMVSAPAFQSPSFSPRRQRTRTSSAIQIRGQGGFHIPSAETIALKREIQASPVGSRDHFAPNGRNARTVAT